MADEIKFPKECKHYKQKDDKQIPLGEIGLDIFLNASGIGGHVCEYCPTASCFFRKHDYLPNIIDSFEDAKEESEHAERRIEAFRNVTEIYGSETDLVKSCPNNDWRGAQFFIGNKNPDGQA